MRVLVEQLVRDARDLESRADRIDGGRDGRIGGRDDLRCSLDVDLVTVVLRRVVARGDDDAGGSVQLLLRERSDRRRLMRGEPVDGDTSRSHDRSDVAGEALGVVARVEGDHDTAVRRGRVGGEQMIDEPSGRTDDDRAVHPVRTGTDTPTQARGAERETAPDEVEERGLVRGPGESCELRAHPRVDVTGGPLLGTTTHELEVHGAPVPMRAVRGDRARSAERRTLPR